MAKELKPAFNKEEYMNRLIHHPVMDRDPEKDFTEKTTPLPKLNYKKYFAFLEFMKKRYGERHHGADVILNKLISSNCVYKKAQFYTSINMTELLNCGIYLYPVASKSYNDIDYSEYSVFIEHEFYYDEDPMKRAIRKIHAEYTIVPIILSQEAEAIYNGFLRKE